MLTLLGRDSVELGSRLGDSVELGSRLGDSVELRSRLGDSVESSMVAFKITWVATTETVTEHLFILNL